MKTNTAAAIVLVLIASAFVAPIVGYFAINLPAEVQYNRTFGGQISITIDQPTTSGMAHGLRIIWAQMNTTFGTSNHGTIYGNGWYWGQTPDNSLASEDRYFSSEIQRLDNYTAAYAEYQKAGVKTVTGLPLIDWYTQIVNNSRHELQRNGGLDWAIEPAWMLKTNPLAYWDWFYFAAYAAVAVVLALVVILRYGPD